MNHNPTLSKPKHEDSYLLVPLYLPHRCNSEQRALLVEGKFFEMISRVSIKSDPILLANLAYIPLSVI